MVSKLELTGILTTVIRFFLAVVVLKFPFPFDLRMKSREKRRTLMYIPSLSPHEDKGSERKQERMNERQTEKNA